MRILKEGHLYELESMEGTNPQRIQFIEKIIASEVINMGIDCSIETNGFVTINDGTTNEEVLKMLIDRCQTLLKKLPSRETALVITKLEEALMWLNKRTENRIKQGVENTSLPHKS